MEDIIVDDWIKWAKEKNNLGRNNIHLLVIGFIEQNPECLSLGKQGAFFIDSKTWEAVSDDIYRMINDKEKWIDPENWSDIDPAGNNVTLDEETKRQYIWMRQNNRPPKIWNNPDNLYDLKDIYKQISGYLGVGSISTGFMVFVQNELEKKGLLTDQDQQPISFIIHRDALATRYEYPFTYLSNARIVFRCNPKYNTEGQYFYIGAYELKHQQFNIRVSIKEDFDDINDPIVVSYASLDELLKDGWTLEGFCHF